MYLYWIIDLLLFCSTEQPLFLISFPFRSLPSTSRWKIVVSPWATVFFSVAGCVYKFHTFGDTISVYAEATFCWNDSHKSNQLSRFFDSSRRLKQREEIDDIHNLRSPSSRFARVWIGIIQRLSVRIIVAAIYLLPEPGSITKWSFFRHFSSS